jgi:hypothetical protein
MVKVKWEHKVILSHGISDEKMIEWEETLNILGEQGWEVVSVIVRPEVPSYETTESKVSNPRAARTVVFLKREKAA